MNKRLRFCYVSKLELQIKVSSNAITTPEKSCVHEILLFSVKNAKANKISNSKPKTCHSCLSHIIAGVTVKEYKVTKNHHHAPETILLLY